MRNGLSLAIGLAGFAMLAAAACGWSATAFAQGSDDEINPPVAYP